jgi:O-antigen/teichoic acid export membrane protein
MSLIKALLFYYALTNGYDLVAMGLISLVCNVTAGLCLYGALRKTEPQVKINLGNADRPTLRSILHFSRFTFLSMLAMQLVYYSDAFVIGFFMTAAAITYYTIPWSLSEYTNKLILAIAQTFVPVFSEQDATQGDKAIYRTYVTGTKFMLLISNLLCLGVLAVGDYFIAIWMGPEYAVKCSALLAIMFLTQIIKGPQLLSYSILLATSRHRIFSFYNFGFSLLNLALSIVLIQHYGLIGVAAATAITQILFYGVITPILTSKVLGSSLWAYCRDTYVRSIPSMIVLYITLKALSDNHTPDGYLILTGQGLAAAVLYMLVAYWTLLNTSERNYLLAGGRNVFARLSPA